jgi:hypothetical protein
MSLDQARRTWDADYENNLFDLVARRHAPEIPAAGTVAPREPQTAEEFAGVAEYLTRVAAHDTFIVQVVAKAIDTLFPDDIEFQQQLARQAGDDAEHAITARERVIGLTGKDPLRTIESYVKGHWEALEDVPYRDWFGFFAFELHYELHIQARLKIESRTGKVRPKAIKKSQTETGQEANDELIHRIYVVNWLDRKFAAATPAEHEEWAQKLIAVDDEVQRRLNPYLRLRVVTGENAWGADTSKSVEIYDAWRREILADVVRKPADRLPRLTSLAA